MFKAAPDILRTLQKFYSIELPIFIDDAESYTSNSFVELPNQIFLLKVSEGNLKIDVEKNFELKIEGVKASDCLKSAGYFLNVESHFNLKNAMKAINSLDGSKKIKSC